MLKILNTIDFLIKPNHSHKDTKHHQDPKSYQIRYQILKMQLYESSTSSKMASLYWFTYILTFLKERLVCICMCMCSCRCTYMCTDTFRCLICVCVCVFCPCGRLDVCVHVLMLSHLLLPRKPRGEAKKCRKVYGMEKRDMWCTACRWKKACQRFTD